MSSYENMQLSCSGLFTMLLFFSIFLFLFYDQSTGVFLFGVSILGFLALTPTAYMPWMNRGYIYGPTMPTAPMDPISDIKIPRFGETLR